MEPRRRFFRQVIREAERPPDDSRPRLKLVKAPATASLALVCLSSRVYQYLTHWDPVEQRTKPCRDPKGKGECPFCDLPQRWKGYVAGFSRSTRQVLLVELTSGAFRHCPQLADAAFDLRGYWIVLRRLKGQRNAPAAVEIGRREDALSLPPEPDVPAALHRLWGIPVYLLEDEEGGGA